MSKKWGDGIHFPRKVPRPGKDRGGGGKTSKPDVAPSTFEASEKLGQTQKRKTPKEKAGWSRKTASRPQRPIPV